MERARRVEGDADEIRFARHVDRRHLFVDVPHGPLRRRERGQIRHGDLLEIQHARPARSLDGRRRGGDEQQRSPKGHDRKPYPSGLCWSRSGAQSSPPRPAGHVRTRPTVERSSSPMSNRTAILPPQPSGAVASTSASEAQPPSAEWPSWAQTDRSRARRAMAAFRPLQPFKRTHYPAISLVARRARRFAGAPRRRRPRERAHSNRAPGRRRP